MPIEEAVAAYLKQPAKGIAPALDDLQMLARYLQHKGELVQAERLLRQANAILDKISLHGTRHSAILADLADVFQQRGDFQATRDLLRKSVDSLANKGKYPIEYDQTPAFAAQITQLFRTLAERLVRVHEELGDHEGVEYWQAKTDASFNAEHGL